MAGGLAVTRASAIAGTIADVETGRPDVARDFWERVDLVLRTGGVLAAGCDETETAASLN